jgi:hypothetical protein
MHHDVKFTGSGVNLEMMLMPGAVSAGQMIEREKASLALWCWVARVVCTAAQYFGWKMLLEPAVVAAAVVPLISRGVAVGTSIVSAILAADIAALTVATAWLSTRLRLAILQLPLNLLYLAALVLSTKFILRCTIGKACTTVAFLAGKGISGARGVLGF